MQHFSCRLKSLQKRAGLSVQTPHISRRWTRKVGKLAMIWKTTFLPPEPGTCRETFDSCATGSCAFAELDALPLLLRLKYLSNTIIRWPKNSPKLRKGRCIIWSLLLLKSWSKTSTLLEAHSARKRGKASASPWRSTCHKSRLILNKPSRRLDAPPQLTRSASGPPETIVSQFWFVTLRNTQWQQWRTVTNHLKSGSQFLICRFSASGIIKLIWSEGN